jgi:hypothetical protein
VIHAQIAQHGRNRGHLQQPYRTAGEVENFGVFAECVSQDVFDSSTLEGAFRAVDGLRDHRRAAGREVLARLRQEVTAVISEIGRGSCSIVLEIDEPVGTVVALVEQAQRACKADLIAGGVIDPPVA